MKWVIIITTLLFAIFSGYTQKNYVSKVWIADNDNGTYKNPVILTLMQFVSGMIITCCHQALKIFRVCPGYADFDWFRVEQIQ
jgi:hypothetical protein